MNITVKGRFTEPTGRSAQPVKESDEIAINKDVSQIRIESLLNFCVALLYQVFIPDPRPFFEQINELF